MSLYSTPTRLALLRQVDNGQVFTDYTADAFAVLAFPDGPTSWQDRVTVTARISEMERAGWVEEQASSGDWRLTAEGRAVLYGGPATVDGRLILQAHTAPEVTP